MVLRGLRDLETGPLLFSFLNFQLICWVDTFEYGHMIVIRGKDQKYFNMLVLLIFQSVFLKLILNYKMLLQKFNTQQNIFLAAWVSGWCCFWLGRMLSSCGDER